MDLKTSTNMHCKQAAIHSIDIVSKVEHPAIAAFAAESSSPSLLLPAGVAESANTDSGKRKWFVGHVMSVLYHHL